jgi:hypothetical protein
METSGLSVFINVSTYSLIPENILIVSECKILLRFIPQIWISFTTTSFIFKFQSVSYLQVFKFMSDVVVKALRYKPAGLGFDFRYCHWNFSVT